MLAESKDIVKISYKISEDCRKKAFVSRGETPSATQTLEAAAELTPDMRALLVERYGLVQHIDLTLDVWQYGPSRPQYERDTIEADPILLLIDWRAALESAQVTFAAKRDAALAEQIESFARWTHDRRPSFSDESRFRGSSLWPQAQAALAEAQAAFDTRKAAEQARNGAEQAKEQAAKQQRLADRVNWIAAHGSAYLKKCQAAGYDCQRAYVTERAALEFPGYTVDFNDNATWRDRSGPSETALDEALRVGGTVVWLTRDVNGEEVEYGEGVEAVAIRQYLGKYDLIKSM